MSNQQKKQLGTPSVTRYLTHAAARAGLDVAAVAAHLSAACADGSSVGLAISEGKTLFHKTCGSRVDLVVVPAVGRPGSYWLGATCPKCLRDLMDGEIFVGESGE